MGYERYCRICGKFFTTVYYRRKTDSIACQIVFAQQKKKERNRKYYKKIKATNKATYKTVCIVCQEPFNTDRYDREVICLGCKQNKKTMFDRKGFDYGYD